MAALDALDALENGGKGQSSRHCCNYPIVASPANLSDDGDLRERVDILSRALDQRLFAKNPINLGWRLMPVNGVNAPHQFGLRLDPFSKNCRAVHNGIDFVAPLARQFRLLRRVQSNVAGIDALSLAGVSSWITAMALLRDMPCLSFVGACRRQGECRRKLPKSAAPAIHQPASAF